jgi:hypothetical protein
MVQPYKKIISILFIYVFLITSAAYPEIADITALRSPMEFEKKKDAKTSGAAERIKKALMVMTGASLIGMGAENMSQAQTAVTPENLTPPGMELAQSQKIKSKLAKKFDVKAADFSYWKKELTDNDVWFIFGSYAIDTNGKNIGTTSPPWSHYMTPLFDPETGRLIGHFRYNGFYNLKGEEIGHVRSTMNMHKGEEILNKNNQVIGKSMKNGVADEDGNVIAVYYGDLKDELKNKKEGVFWTIWDDKKQQYLGYWYGLGDYNSAPKIEGKLLDSSVLSGLLKLRYGAYHMRNWIIELYDNGRNEELFNLAKVFDNNALLTVVTAMHGSHEKYLSIFKQELKQRAEKDNNLSLKDFADKFSQQGDDLLDMYSMLLILGFDLDIETLLQKADISVFENMVKIFSDISLDFRLREDTREMIIDNLFSIVEIPEQYSFWKIEDIEAKNKFREMAAEYLIKALSGGELNKKIFDHLNRIADKEPRFKEIFFEQKPEEAKGNPEFLASGISGHTEIDVMWLFRDMLPDSVSVTEYEVKYRKSSFGNDAEGWLFSETVAKDKTIFKISDLEAGVDYDIEVTAMLSDGNSASGEFTARTINNIPAISVPGEIKIFPDAVKDIPIVTSDLDGATDTVELFLDNGKGLEPLSENTLTIDAAKKKPGERFQYRVIAKDQWGGECAYGIINVIVVDVEPTAKIQHTNNSVILSDFGYKGEIPTDLEINPDSWKIEYSAVDKERNRTLNTIELPNGKNSIEIEKPLSGWAESFKLTFELMDGTIKTGYPVRFETRDTVETAAPQRSQNIFRIFQNYPNPFRDATTIQYELPAQQNSVNVYIHGINGRIVRELNNLSTSEGIHNFTWDGKDNAGLDAASGVYLVTVISKDNNAVHKKTIRTIFLGRSSAGELGLFGAQDKTAFVQYVNAGFTSEIDMLITRTQDLQKRLADATKLKAKRSYKEEIVKLRKRMIELENTRIEVLSGVTQTPFYSFTVNLGARGIREGL